MLLDALELEEHLGHNIKSLDGLVVGLESLKEHSCLELLTALKQHNALLIRCRELITSAVHHAAMIQNQVERRINVFKNDLNKFASLPAEVLSAIFEQTLHDDASSLSLSLEHTTLRSITSVCRRWREVAMHTPRLWARLWVSRAGLMCSPNPIEDMRQRLSQSRHAPLLIHLNLLHYRHLPRPRSLDTPGMSLLAPHFSRLQTFIIELCLVDLEFIISLLAKDIPHLTRFQLNISGIIDDIEVPDLLPIAPPGSLTHVQFNLGEIMPFSMPNFGSIASHATYIKILVESATAIDLLNLLSDAQCVEELDLTESRESRSDVPGSNLVLPCLRTWHFTTPRQPKLLQYLECPLLEELTLSCLPWRSNLSLRAEFYPNLRSIICEKGESGIQIAEAFDDSQGFAITSLDLILDVVDLLGFGRLLARKDTSDNNQFRCWRSLTRLTVTITPEMAGGVQFDGRTPANILISRLVSRTGLTLIARIRRADFDGDGWLGSWVKEATNVLGDRFRWIYEVEKIGRDNQTRGWEQ